MGKSKEQVGPHRAPARTTRKQSKEGSRGKGKGIATSTSPTHDEMEHDQERQHTSAPWPRMEGTAFPTGRIVQEIPHTTLSEIQKRPGYSYRKPGHAWDEFNSLFYNGLRQVSMVPTRFVCPRTLQKMGIAEDVQSMLRQMGLGTLAYKTYPLYPDVVRQFLASVELRFEDIALHQTDEGTLSYLSSGILYEISIPDLCDIYGFDRTIPSCRFPTFPLADELWGLLGSGPFYSANSRKAKLSLIRNPVIRILAKILGHSFNAKEETGSLSVAELMMIHYGLPSPDDIYGKEVPAELTTNLGAVFAAMLVTKKSRGLNTLQKAKIEGVGSLLTPIFQFHGIDLSSPRCVSKIEYYDERFLSNNNICDAGFKYKFYDRSLVLRRCQLPLPAFTSPISRDNLEFYLAPEFYLPDPPSVRRRGGPSVGPVSQSEEERVRDDFAPRAPASFEPLLPAYDGQYDLPSFPHDGPDSDRWQWMETSQRAQHSMLRTMWNALSKLSCPPPPSCFRPSTTETRGGDDAPRAGPSVAGHRTSDEDDESGDGRLRRRRRAVGESRSASSEDH